MADITGQLLIKQYTEVPNDSILIICRIRPSACVHPDTRKHPERDGSPQQNKWTNDHHDAYDAETSIPETQGQNIIEHLLSAEQHPQPT